jgi:hypothetical protein
MNSGLNLAENIFVKMLGSEGFGLGDKDTLASSIALRSIELADIFYDNIDGQSEPGIHNTHQSDGYGGSD